MKQVVQGVKRGKVRVEELPPPALKPGGVLVRTVASVISAGTERLALEFGRKSLLTKARERPDLVRQVMDKVKREGIVPTYKAVRGRLGMPLSLGYSSAGVVQEVVTGEEGFQVGDRVACAGVGYANHAEVVWVPKNLCLKIPDILDFEEASFGAIGAIALQGVRLVEPTLGESIVVIGLGLIGQIAVQCFKANGCRVLGLDPEANRVALAKQLGADEAIVSGESSLSKAVQRFTRDRGADAVLIAAATESNEPVELAGEICRDRGRVVIVGAVRIDVPRRTYYEKELDLRVSRSYGPGRYDPTYEEKGVDYPIGYVRWTEQRNIEAFHDLLVQRKVDVQKLITHRFPIEKAEKAYDLLGGQKRENYLGILLTYPDNRDEKPTIPLISTSQVGVVDADQVNFGVIGAGDFARSTLLPILERLPSVSLKGIATATGISSKSTGTRFGFEYCTTDYHEILNDEGIHVVLIATRHHLHAPLVIEALKARKHVFVEKPLCLSVEELQEIIETHQSLVTNEKFPPLLMVGFNRRFAPYTQKAREFFAGREGPMVINYRVNAGSVSPDHWVNDPEEGGGRIVGEVCHFVDFVNYVVGKQPVRVFAEGATADTAAITLKYEDSSIGSIQYLANGHRTFSKERVEIFGDGSVFVIDDFRRAGRFSDASRARFRSGLKQDKGHQAELKAFVDAVLRGASLAITPEDAFETMRVTFRIVESLARGAPVEVFGGH